ncbi:NGCA protein, partial [Rynchops niger]|nr:NGCA protein [Rynchops niger]
IAEVPGASRRAVREGALVLSRLEPNDTLVAQCEAYNRHGRLLANAFVYVVGAWGAVGNPRWPPGTPLGHWDPAPGTQIPLQPSPCQGRSPGATASLWLTPELEPALQDDRAFVFTNGTLRLGPVAQGDGGVFTCRAHNPHSNASVAAHLDVKGTR